MADLFHTDYIYFKYDRLLHKASVLNVIECKYKDTNINWKLLLKLQRL